jgi:hypothetical protein
LPNAESVDETVAEIRRLGGRLVSVTPHKGSLEDLFFQEAGPTADTPANLITGSMS